MRTSDSASFLSGLGFSGLGDSFQDHFSFASGSGVQKGVSGSGSQCRVPMDFRLWVRHV